MPLVSAIAWGALLVMLGLAAANDLESRRIPNVLIVSAVGVALLLQVLSPTGGGFFAATRPGGQGLVLAGGATLIALLIGIMLWQLRLFGAGDAKLLAACAAWLGWGAVLPLYLFTLLSGGALALAWLAWRWWTTRAGRAPPPDRRLPYSVAVAIGAITTALTLQLGVTNFTFV
jgi:prepilin peptidase CpaA